MKYESAEISVSDDSGNPIGSIKVYDGTLGSKFQTIDGYEFSLNDLKSIISKIEELNHGPST